MLLTLGSVAFFKFFEVDFNYTKATFIAACLVFIEFVQKWVGWVCLNTAKHHKTRSQINLTKCVSWGAHSPVRGHPRGSKFVPLNSWGRGSY